MLALSTDEGVTRVHMWSRRSRLVGYSVSAYLVGGVLIDTGFPAASGGLARLLDERRPRGVVLTHHHEDHAGNVGLVARRGIPIAAAADTIATLRAGERAGLYRRFVWSEMLPLSEPVEPLEPEGLELIHTPGHSADHRVVWHAERRILFAGDLFLGVKVRVARPGEDPRALARSLRAAAALRPRLMFDAHRGAVPNPAESLLAKADWLDETIARIDRLLDAGRPLASITREVLGPEDFVAYFSLGDLSRANFVRAVAATRS
jgi:glyoxylase-like metal-dependent hydrolase (beta-lactamase superfamily II)